MDKIDLVHVNHLFSLLGLVCCTLYFVCCILGFAQQCSCWKETLIYCPGSVLMSIHSPVACGSVFGGFNTDRRCQSNVR